MYLTLFSLLLPLLLEMMKHRYHNVFLVPELDFPPTWKEGLLLRKKKKEEEEKYLKLKLTSAATGTGS